MDDHEPDNTSERRRHVEEAIEAIDSAMAAKPLNPFEMSPPAYLKRLEGQLFLKEIRATLEAKLEEPEK